ncbi:hypothetical protein E0K89_009540 [Aquicoccus sp. SCR17]|nr:hypothetical protein [Carideicomes alvinocaridis]
MTPVSRFAAGLLLGAVLAACAPMAIATPFRAEEVRGIKRDGRARIEGQAFLRQRGGGVVTCAGSGVLLIPAGGYATELFTRVWGNPEGGVAGTFVMGPKTLPPGFLEYTRQSRCDAEGDFVFERVPDGTYFVASQVTWTVPGSYLPEGGVVGRRIAVRGGRSQRVLISGGA